ncbi:MAG: hypothetical protein HYY78_21060 [Betaproteobacteria bacterium]|nr:hypothetical protein [Betaproteobacteria bacterium]
MARSSGIVTTQILTLAPYAINDYLGLRRNDYLRSFLFDFIETYAPRLRRPIVEKALSAQ